MSSPKKDSKCRSWVDLPGKNCYGMNNIPNDINCMSNSLKCNDCSSTAQIGKSSLDDCKAAAEYASVDGSEYVNCVTFDPSTGNCWFRNNCEIGCIDDSNYQSARMDDKLF